ncbi:MAG: hypothetical protein BroJett039_06830 [Chloroflexota bacterium]|nr:MAG: hypothetical protein BroJett039_06830 [Chloroflexota bacterium]
MSGAGGTAAGDGTTGGGFTIGGGGATGCVNGARHLLQKRAPLRFCVPQLGHGIVGCVGAAVCVGAAAGGAAFGAVIGSVAEASVKPQLLQKRALG